MFNKILEIFSFILDKVPGRVESLKNEIQGIKDELHDMQQKKTTWTVADTVHYYELTERLSKLEKRASNSLK